MIVKTKAGAFDKVILNARKQINLVDRYDNDYVLTWKIAIPSIVKILNRIYLANNMHGKYASTLYDGHGETLNHLLRNFL